MPNPLRTHPAPGERPRQSTRMDMGSAFTPADFPHRLHWAAMVDAGLIGQNPPTPPDVAANRAATDALFRAIRTSRRRLG